MGTMGNDWLDRQYARPLPEREPDGEWRDFDDWVRNATGNIGGRNALCADARGRVCACGGDFMRARADGAFPVRFWHGAGAATESERARDERRAQKLLYPWRPTRRRSVI